MVILARIPLKTAGLAPCWSPTHIPVIGRRGACSQSCLCSLLSHRTTPAAQFPPLTSPVALTNLKPNGHTLNAPNDCFIAPHLKWQRSTLPPHHGDKVARRLQLGIAASLLLQVGLGDACWLQDLRDTRHLSYCSLLLWLHLKLQEEGLDFRILH